MKTVLINIPSNSMGDIIAATPYVSEYQKKHQHNVLYKINSFLIPFLKNEYKNLTFIDKDTDIQFDETINLDYIFFESVQGGYAKQLGFENPKYIRPVITPPNSPRTIKNKYISLNVHSTAQVKYWNHPEGIKSQVVSPYWNELSSTLRKLGYTPVTVERDELFGVPPFRNGLPSKANNKVGVSIQDLINLLTHCEFYIGLSSGISWLAHSLGKKVAMISNFTEDWTEFDLSEPDYIRITNKSVCHGCWNRVNIDHAFKADDWYWCPKHQNTERQFECHKSITPQMVIDQIQPFL
jgi:autotransporter strand-loop-strand O-heptosyltransferase